MHDLFDDEYAHQLRDLPVETRRRIAANRLAQVHYWAATLLADDPDSSGSLERDAHHWRDQGERLAGKPTAQTPARPHLRAV